MLAKSTKSWLRIHRPSFKLFMSAAAVSANPLLIQDFTPQFRSIQPSHVKPSIDLVLSNLETDLANLETSLEANPNAQYSDVIEAVEKISSPLEYAWGTVGHLVGIYFEFVVLASF
jgi:Zn-dependent oligopeptidase